MYSISGVMTPNIAGKVILTESSIVDCRIQSKRFRENYTSRRLIVIYALYDSTILPIHFFTRFKG